MNAVEVHPPEAPAHPFRRAYAATLVLPAVAVSAALVACGFPSPYGLGRFLGQFTLGILVAGLLAGLLARRNAKGWPWWKHLLVVIPVQLVMHVVVTAAKAAN